MGTVKTARKVAEKRVKTPLNRRKSKGEFPLDVAALKPAPYNPRTITTEALEGLKRSLGEFGDLSGLVWNRRSGHLVAGHQRLEALKREHGEGLRMEAGAVVTPAGQSFPVRVVDWPEDREKAANLAANSPLLAGSFDPAGLEAVLADLNAADGLAGLLDGLRLGELVPGLGDLIPGGELLGPEAASGRALAVGSEDAVPGGDAEWLNFSVPLSVGQHKTVMDAIRLARQRGAAKVSDGLAAMAHAYLGTDKTDKSPSVSSVASL